MNKETIKENYVLNIKGEVCPYTFVRSKLKLEEMGVGEILKIIIDSEPAMKNVPRSIANEGNEVLDVSKINDTDWQIIVKKG